MELLFLYPTYNRAKVLGECLNTSLGNTSISPEEIYILDDGSNIETQKEILVYAQKNRDRLTMNVILSQKNYGIGWNFEQIYNIIRWKQPRIFGLIESDYIWRQEYMEDIMAVFDASPHTVAIAGVSHPDMYNKQKTHELFPRLMMEQFPSDVKAREFMYQPFNLATSRGNIKVQGVSNSCGCHFFHFERFQKLIKDIGREEEYWKWMDRAFNKHDAGNRRNASDQHISSTPTWYFEEWALKHGIDISKHFAWLDICDASISQHLCGMGENGMIVPEGQTFINSPCWYGTKFNRSEFNKLSVETSSKLS